MVQAVAEKKQKQAQNDGAGDTRVLVCETGFAFGHSAALFLGASKHVDVVSFDLFDRPAQSTALAALRRAFPGQTLTNIAGDSCPAG